MHDKVVAMTASYRSRIACALLAAALVLLPSAAFAREASLQGPNGNGGSCPEASAVEQDPASAPQAGKRGPVRDKAKATPMVRSGGDTPARPRWHSILPGMFR